MRAITTFVFTLMISIVFSQEITEVEFESPFKNTLKEAIVDCDTVFKYLQTIDDSFSLNKIEEWDSGYIVTVYDDDWSFFTVYYYDSKDDIRLDLVEGQPF